MNNIEAKQEKPNYTKRVKTCGDVVRGFNFLPGLGSSGFHLSSMTDEATIACKRSKRHPNILLKPSRMQCCLPRLSNALRIFASGVRHPLSPSLHFLLPKSRLVLNPEPKPKPEPLPPRALNQARGCSCAGFRRVYFSLP